MQISRLKNNMASILAFGHMNGLGRARHSHSQAVAKPVYLEEPSMTAADMGVTFENCPELFRAIHPVFSGRSLAVAETEPQLETTHSVQPGEFKPRLGWTWETYKEGDV